MRLEVAIASFYVPILLGWLSRRMGWVDEQTPSNLSTLIAYFFLPSLIFRLIAGGRLTLAEAGMAAVAAGTIITVSLTASIVLFRGDKEKLLTGAFHNAGYLPLPLTYALWGEKAAAIVGIFSPVLSTTINTLGPLIAAGNLRYGLNALKRYPPIAAACLALALKGLSIEVPGELLQVLEPLSSATIPVALVMLGMQLEGAKGVWRDAVEVGAIRFILTPLAAITIFTQIVPVGGILLKVLVVESFMPPAVTNVVITDRFGLNARKTAFIVFICTVFSLTIVPGVAVLAESLA